LSALLRPSKDLHKGWVQGRRRRERRSPFSPPASEFPTILPPTTKEVSDREKGKLI